MPAISDPWHLSVGINCQVYVYEILRHQGKTVADFRSLELWQDKVYSFQSKTFELLDLMFYLTEARDTEQMLGSIYRAIRV